MSDATSIAAGAGAGAVVTVAMRAAGEPAAMGLAVGGAAGLFLALIPRSRPTGLALLAASVIGAVVVAQAPKRRTA